MSSLFGKDFSAERTRALESIQAGKRLAETPFTNLKVAAKGQQSVFSMLQKSDSTGSFDSVKGGQV